MRTALVILPLYLTCCGAPGESATEESQAPIETTVEAAEPEPCGMVFSPVPELLEATTAAAVRWSTATGCDVRVGDGGLPVTLVADMRDPEGNPVNGRARVFSDVDTGAYVECKGLLISTAATGRTVPHEMGHCLGAMGHATDGMLSEYSDGGDAINAAALGLVCENLDCAAFIPE